MSPIEPDNAGCIAFNKYFGLKSNPRYASKHYYYISHEWFRYTSTSRIKNQFLSLLLATPKNDPLISSESDPTRTYTVLQIFEYATRNAKKMILEAPGYVTYNAQNWPSKFASMQPGAYLNRPEMQTAIVHCNP